LQDLSIIPESFSLGESTFYSRKSGHRRLDEGRAGKRDMTHMGCKSGRPAKIGAGGNPTNDCYPEY